MPIVVQPDGCPSGQTRRQQCESSTPVSFALPLLPPVNGRDTERP